MSLLGPEVVRDQSQYQPVKESSFFILFNFLAFFLPSGRGSAQESVCSSSESEISSDSRSSKPASPWSGLRVLFPTMPAAVELKGQGELREWSWEQEDISVIKEPDNTSLVGSI